MVDIADINDGKSLEEWLQDRSHDEAMMIAHRAVMRVTPVYLQYVQRSPPKVELTELPALRICLISRAAGTRPTPEFKASTAFATAFAAYAAADEIWRAVRADCTALVSGARLTAVPLWHDARSPFHKTWRQVRQNWSRRGPGWQFWINWYEDALAGREPSEELFTDIGLIAPEDWNKGPDYVNGLIGDIHQKFALSSTPNAEDIIINDQGKYQVNPRSQLPAKTLQDVHDRLNDTIRQIRAVQEQEGNQYHPLNDEADLLQDILHRYPDNALRIHEVCSKVVLHVGRHVSTGVMPENDNFVGDVVIDLQNSADDIYNFDAETKSAVDARAKLRFDRLSDDQKIGVSQAAEAVAVRSDDAMAAEMSEDGQAVASDQGQSEESVPNRYRLGSRLIRIVALGGKALKKTTQGLGVIGSVGGGVAALWSIIRFLTGLG